MRADLQGIDLPRNRDGLGASGRRWLAATLVLLVASCAPHVWPPVVVPPPPPGAVRYAVGGDSRADDFHVVLWAFQEAHVAGVTAFMYLGDMELTPALDGHFVKELKQLDPVAFYPVLGNHDAKFFGKFKSRHPDLEKRFRKTFLGTPNSPVQSALPDKIVYSTNLPGGLHFVALDNVSQNGFGPDQLAWLAQDLEHARADSSVRHIVIGMHKPLAKNSATRHSMDRDGNQAIKDSDDALDLFEKAHVDLILACHVHQYAQFKQRGITSVITGGLGAPLTEPGPEHGFHHMLLLDVKDDGIGVQVVRFPGPSNTSPDEVED
jgi:hypothetical protein